MARTVTIGIDQGSYSFTDNTKVITLSNIDFTPSLDKLAYVVNLTQKDTYYAPTENYIKCSISGHDITITDNSKPNLRTGDILHIQFFYPENIQYPLPVDGDSVYAKDVWVEESDTTGWTDEDNTGLDKVFIPFTSLFSRLHNATSDNPKILLVYFKRTIDAHQVGIGSVGSGETFSNVKIILLGSANIEREIVDDSTNDTKYESKNYEFEPQLFNAIRLEFHTTDTVCISNITIQKACNSNSFIKLQQPDKTVVNAQGTRRGNFRVAIEEYGDTASIDAFSRLRVSNPYTIFDSKQLHDKNSLFWDEETGGNATSTHSTVDARTRLAVTADAGDYVIRQTKMRFNYQPGKSALVLFTFFNEHEQGLTKRCGLFDGTGANYLTPNNGIYYQTDNDISWCIAKNGTVTESVSQANWNVDTLDGSGDENNKSGKILVSDATHIGIIDFEWLGVGRVRVGFVIDGIIYYVHQFNHANSALFDSVYMSTPNLPLRYDIQSDGTIGGYLDHICSSVMSEGGREDNGIIKYQSTEGTHVDCNTENTLYAIIGLRLKTTALDTTVKILNTALQEQAGSKKLEWVLLFNPTVAGTFTYTDITNSAVQYAVGSTENTVTGGIRSAGGFLESGGQQSGNAGGDSSNITNALLLGSSIDGTRDTIVLCAKPVGGTANADVEGAINWREID